MSAEEVEPTNFHPGALKPDNFPGEGIAQHPMLYIGEGEQGPQLVEITRDKKVVWVLQDWQHLGSATAVQILDEPGIPEHPGDSLH